MSARARGWIYVALFLLALGVGVPVFIFTASEDVQLIALGVVALAVIGGGVVYAGIEAVRFVRSWNAAVERPRNAVEPEAPAVQRSSFKPEYARKFGERADGHDSQGQDGIETDER